MGTCRDSCCGFYGSVTPLPPGRTGLARQAFRLEWLTVAWMIVEGALAIGADRTAIKIGGGLLFATILLTGAASAAINGGRRDFRTM